ncbi:hypothetical protein [Glycomyces rhizosphaerae]|uniref:Uncharacterized protein n=1 Tax=Glycomyces rhizosphaerae TaxID=2054422 RepID=A0ABV7Q0V4_9ACTN
MSPQRPSDAEAEAQVSRTLRQASSGYGDLPEHVGDRLDRVLDSLPPADTLHTGPRESAFESWAERWAERLRPKRVRYAIVSAAAAVLVTVGGVATAVQFVSGPGNEDSGASADLQAESDTERSDDAGAPGAADEEETPMSGAETEDEAAAGGITGVETFASGSDYSEGTDLLTALRELDADSAAGEVPAELTELAAGGEFWKNCEEAIAHEYASLLVAVDFAHYDSQPAIVALMVGESGDIAVALTPACADGVIEPLAKQP